MAHAHRTCCEMTEKVQENTQLSDILFHQGHGELFSEEGNREIILGTVLLILDDQIKVPCRGAMWSMMKKKLSK